MNVSSEEVNKILKLNTLDSINAVYKRDKNNKVMFTKLITLTGILLSIISCNKNKKQDIDLNLSNNNTIIYNIDFPDTINVNEVYNGIVYYKSILDTITENFGIKGKSRYSRFLLTTTDNIDYDYIKLREIHKDTFWALNNKEIPFYKISFDKPGVFYIDGLIDDIVLLDTIIDSKRSTLLIREQERVSHKIVVVNPYVLNL